MINLFNLLGYNDSLTNGNKKPNAETTYHVRFEHVFPKLAELKQIIIDKFHESKAISHPQRK